MNSEVSRYLEQLKKKRQEIREVKKEIDLVNQQYEQSMKILNKKLHEKNQELLCMRDSTYFVFRLDDLIQEISKLSGIDISEIMVKLETNVAFVGEHSFSRMLELLRNDGRTHFIRIDLRSKKDKGFHYFTFLPLDFEAIQSNGDKLIDHCSLSVKGLGESVYTEIDIDKNIDDILLMFDLSYLETKDNTSWYPADLFAQAMANCSLKKNIMVCEKVKRRVRLR